MTGRPRALRQRVWAGGDKADARSVGESLRNLESASAILPALRVVPFADQVYQSDGLTFSASNRPLGVSNIYAETASGSHGTSRVTGLAFDGQVCTVKLGDLTAGELYTTIRLLVIG